jgi:cell wall assembly regulator SMI1
LRLAGAGRVFAENTLVLTEIDGENVIFQVQPSGVGGRRLLLSPKPGAAWILSAARRAPMSIANDWQRITAWYNTHTRPGGFRLNAGAAPAAIAAFEQRVGGRLPDDFRESVRLHDGGDADCWLLWYGEFLTLDGMATQWQQYQDWGAEGLPFDWDVGYLPVTDNSGTHLIVDIGSPPAEGYGRVLLFEHESDGPEEVAPSWAAFLSQLATDLEGGQYVYFPAEGCVGLPGMW